MLVYFSKKTKKYSGVELRSLFAYKEFGIQGDSLVAFCGPCFVDLPELVDQEDVKLKAYIQSESMVHFICEKFALDLEEGIFRQRLYIANIKEVLEEHGVKLVRNGNDLYLDKKKLSVSIATLSPVSTLIHIGVNISSKNTPVKTIGLSDLGIKPDKFIAKVFQKVQAEEKSMIMARAKVRGVN